MWYNISLLFGNISIKALVSHRPPNFKYQSGQWVRLSCTAFRQSEYHSFTLTSAPHQNFLSCHIKAQGPWTWKLRKFFDPHNYIHDEDNPPRVSKYSRNVIEKTLRIF